MWHRWTLLSRVRNSLVLFSTQYFGGCRRLLLDRCCLVSIVAFVVHARAAIVINKQPNESWATWPQLDQTPAKTSTVCSDKTTACHDKRQAQLHTQIHTHTQSHKYTYPHTHSTSTFSQIRNNTFNYTMHAHARPQTHNTQRAHFAQTPYPTCHNTSHRKRAKALPKPLPKHYQKRYTTHTHHMLSNVCLVKLMWNQ